MVPFTHFSLVTLSGNEELALCLPWSYRYSDSFLLHGNKGTADLMSPHGGNRMAMSHAVFVSEPLIGTKGFNDLL